MMKVYKPDAKLSIEKQIEAVLRNSKIAYSPLPT